MSNNFLGYVYPVFSLAVFLWHGINDYIQSPNFHFKTLIIVTIITHREKFESIVLQTPLMSCDLLANALSRISVTPSVS